MVGVVYVIGVVGLVVGEKAKSQQKIVKNIQNRWSGWSKVVNVTCEEDKETAGKNLLYVFPSLAS